MHGLRYCVVYAALPSRTKWLNFVQVLSYSIISAVVAWSPFVSLCLHSNGCYLISGSTSGCIYAWHLRNTSTQDDANDSLQSVLQFQGHKSAVNGCRYASRLYL